MATLNELFSEGITKIRLPYWNEYADTIHITLWEKIDNQHTPFRLKVKDGKLLIALGTTYNSNYIPFDKVVEYWYNWKGGIQDENR